MDGFALNLTIMKTLLPIFFVSFAACIGLLSACEQIEKDPEHKIYPTSIDAEWFEEH